MKVNNFRLSVIIPCYNCEKYIRRCVESIIENSYDDTEILLVNDGSKDKTLDELKKIEKEYNNILVIDKKNTGVSDTRNCGIENASGQYIAFVDSDDYIRNNMMKKMIDNIIDNNADIICCDFVEKHSDNISNSKFHYENGLYDSTDVIKDFLKGKISISIWDKVFSKKILSEVKFNTNLAVGEDSLFCLESFIMSKKIYFLEEALYIYVQNDNSAVHSVSNKILQISSLEKYIPEKVKNEYTEEYNYFIADCMLRCIHTLSGNCTKSNKRIVEDYIKKIYDKEKIKTIINSDNSSVFNKIEMKILKTFGVKMHLRLYKFYKIIRKLVRS